jgi:hypothetical protein
MFVVTATSQELPLSEPPFSSNNPALPPIPFDAAKALYRLLTAGKQGREAAAQELKLFGDAKTAVYIEGLLIGGKLDFEARKDFHGVLEDLSFKYRDYLLDTRARLRRLMALAVPITPKTKTPPHGLPAYKRS